MDSLSIISPKRVNALGRGSIRLLVAKIISKPNPRNAVQFRDKRLGWGLGVMGGCGVVVGITTIVAVGVFVDIRVGVIVAVADGVSVAVAVKVAVDVHSTRGRFVGVQYGRGVLDAVAVKVKVGLGVKVFVDVAVNVAVGVKVNVDVGV